MTTLAFVDTETTGLDPIQHEIWEVGLVIHVPPDEDGKAPTDEEHHWFLQPEHLASADPMALSIGRFYERHPEHVTVWGDEQQTVTPTPAFCREFARLTSRAHLVGAVVSFDERRLDQLLRRHGFAPSWHYHLIDVEALAAGWLARDVLGPRDVLAEGATANTAVPPWSSDQLSRVLGVDPERFDRHTALGDARWAQAIYGAVMQRWYA